MSKDRLILLLTIVGIIILLVVNLEIVKELPMTSRQKYNVKSENPLGLSVLSKSLEKIYGGENIKVVNSLNILDSISAENTLLIRFGDKYEPSNDDLTSLIEKGLQVIIASEDVYMYADSFSIYTKSRNYRYKDTLSIKLNLSTINKEVNTFIDTMITYTQSKLTLRVYNEEVSEALTGADTLLNQDSLELDSDTLYNYQESDSVAVSEDATDTFEDDDYDEYDEEDYIEDDLESDSLFEIYYEKLITSDSNLIALELPMKKGKLIVHTLPRLFTNLSALNSKLYLDHFNYVFSRVKAKKVIIWNENNIVIGDQSKFSVLLENRGFRAAYFTLLGALLVYILFGFKRRMRPIKLMVNKKNTTLGYVGILARLYQSQKQPRKLIHQIQKNFEDYIHFHYNLKDYSLDLLSKKTKVDIVLIKSIYSDFDRLVKTNDFDEVMLITLNNKIANFKNQAHDRRR